MLKKAIASFFYIFFCEGTLFILTFNNGMHNVEALAIH